MEDLHGRTYVVTGANTGIGRATAHELARRGGRVVLACRSEAKTAPVVEDIVRTTGNDAVEHVPLDLADLDSVRTAADRLLAGNQPLHCLVNNAGVGGQRGATEQGFEITFGVNHLGHFLLTTLLLDRLRATATTGDPARVVTVSSDAHYSATGIDFDAVTQPTRGVTGLREYSVSKLANVLFTQELARRVPAAEVGAYAVHPGVIASDIWRRLPWPIEPIFKLFLKSPEEGARTSLYCATSPEVVGASGGFYVNSREREASSNATPELARALWEHSERWVAPAATP